MLKGPFFFWPTRMDFEIIMAIFFLFLKLGGWFLVRMVEMGLKHTKLQWPPATPSPFNHLKPPFSHVPLCRGRVRVLGDDLIHFFINSNRHIIIKAHLPCWVRTLPAPSDTWKSLLEKSPKPVSGGLPFMFVIKCNWKNYHHRIGKYFFFRKYDFILENDTYVKKVP